MSMAKKPSFYRSPTGALCVTSGVTVVFECFGGHQLEYLKILKQTGNKPYPEILRGIVGGRGLGGLWDGFLPWGLVQAAAKGAVFGWAHAFMTKYVAKPAQKAGVPPSVTDTLSGACAGGVQGLVLSPTLLLKTRVMTDPHFQNFEHTTKANTLTMTVESCRVGARVIRSEGLWVLMKGADTFALKRVADWGTRYAFTNIVEQKLYGGKPSKSLTYSQRVSASLLGGFLSACCTLPLDVLVANIQSAQKAGSNSSALGHFFEEYRQGGASRVAGFATRGFFARAAHVSLTTAVVKTLSSYVTDLLADDAL